MMIVITLPRSGSKTYLVPGLGHYSPLRDRLFKFTDCADPKGTCTPRDQKPSNRPAKYRNWSDVSLREALAAVNVQGMSVAKAAELYGIPRTTLNDYKLSNSMPGVKPGRPTLLSSSEENDLAHFLLSSAEIGYSRTRLEVLSIVERMLSARGDRRVVTSGWWNKFAVRHPQLTLRAASTLSTNRAKASTRECIDNYFDVLEQTLNDSGLIDHPSLIFNMDESGFPLDPKPLKTIHKRGVKNPMTVSSGSKAQITVVACVSASGQCIPPLIVWKRKSMITEMAHGELPGTRYGFTEKGWMTGKLFDSWFKKHFIRYAPASRPLLLLLDGHSSHYSPSTLKLAADSGVIIFTLPPNTTHLTQPLDKGVFGPCKIHWRRICHDFVVSHPGRVVNEHNFVSLLSKAWVESMTTVNIVAGFATCGVFPVNRDAIQLPGDSNAEECFIAPHPVYTPFKHPVNDGLFTSDALPEVTVDLARRPNALMNIVDLPTPKLKTQRIRAPSEMVITSAEFQEKLAEQAASKKKKKTGNSKDHYVYAIQ